MKERIKWPAGNRLDLCIPLRKITVTEEGTQFGEYIPSQAAVVMVYFVGNYASYEYTPRIEDNKLYISDNGELKPGVYAIDVRIQEPERKLRSFRCGELEIVRETKQLVLGDFVLDNNITLDADAFIFGEGPSAFETAVRDGYTGTKAEWLESLRGKEGRGIADIVALPTGAFRILLTDGSAYVTPILKGEQGVSIVDFTVSSITSQEVLCTITMSDGTTRTVNFPRGEKGEQGDAGEDGRGIQSVVMNNDYTITFSYTDGTSYTTPQALRGEQGAAGQDGQDGRGISSMALDDDNHLTVSYTDGTTYTTPQSLQGERGVSITDFEQVGESATMTFFNIYYSNGNISQIALPKGEQGDRGEQGPQGPKGDTVVLGEVGEYKLYNVGGTATDGAMTQDATTKAIAASNGYYECGTAAGTAAKVAVGDNEALYTLQKGGSIKVKMTNANAAASGVTLKIGSAAATPLYYNGEAVSSSNTWEAGEVVEVYYDGSVYQATNAQGGGGKAEKIKYDNSQSGLIAENVQEAMDELHEDVFGDIQYYNDATYVMTGTSADRNYWITFPVVSGHTYKIYIKSDAAYSASSAPTLYLRGFSGTKSPSTSSVLAGITYNLVANQTISDAGIKFNSSTAVGIEGVSLYIKVKDVTDETTMEKHVITDPSVLLPEDVVNNLSDGGVDKVLSAEMGKEIGEAISTMKDLELQPLVRKTWGNDFALKDSTTRVCTADTIFVPYFGMTVHYKLPTGYWIFAAFSTFAGPGTLNVNTGWLEESGTFTIPSDRAQYRIQFAKGSNRNQTLTIEEIQGLLDSKSITFQYESDDSLREIIRRNEHNRYIYSTIIDYGSKKDGLHQLPTFVHGSDVHGDRIRMRNMMRFADHIKAHAALITGDFVAIYPATGYGFINVISDEFNTPMLICDGNHDAQSPLNNDTNRYNAMFKHLAEKHGYMLDDETLSTKCYYYYDMATIKIRVISVDLYEGGSSFSSTQQTWLKETMASTPDGYGIIIIDHVQVTSGLTPIQNAEDWYIKPTNAEKTALRDIVTAFIGRTGDFSEATTTAEFIMFCNGHNHWDGIGYVTGTSYKQLNCNVDTMNGLYAASTLDSQTSRFPRILGDQSEDLFNIYAIDRENKQVRIARVGANMTGDFTKVEHVVVKYAD